MKNTNREKKNTYFESKCFLENCLNSLLLFSAEMLIFNFFFLLIFLLITFEIRFLL